MFTHRRQLRHEGVAGVDGRSPAVDQLDQAECRTLAHIVDILLVGDPQHQNARAVEAALMDLVQRLSQPRHHIARHGGVNLAGKHDKAGGETEFARLQVR